MKKFLSLSMAAVLGLSVIIPVNSNAAGAVKLSKKTATVKVGETKKIKLLNNKKNVKWTVSNKKLKLVKKSKSYATVKGISSGTSDLIAKIGKKSYKCKITIKKKSIETQKPTNTPVPTETPMPTNTTVPTETPIITNEPVQTNTPIPTNTIIPSEIPTTNPTVVPTITVETEKPLETERPLETEKPEPTSTPNSSQSDSGNSEKKLLDNIVSRCEKDNNNHIFGFYENKNNIPISIEVNTVFYDDKGNMIDCKSSYNNCLGVGKTCVLVFNEPYDDDFKEIPYSSYKQIITVEKSYYIDYSNQISLKTNISNDTLITEVRNNGENKVGYIYAVVVFYDENKKIIGYDDAYPKCENKDSIDVEKFYFPTDYDTYECIKPSSYEIIINCAYGYN